jgi:hypothetical protein
MSQGDVWKTADGRKGIEVRRNDKELLLSMMREDWPFPDYPIWVKKANCRKLPSRYHGGAVLDEPEEALL